MSRSRTFIADVYPESRAVGFTRYDGTIEFYGRINSLLGEDHAVLDFGAGRAAWLEDESSPYKRGLRLMRGKVRRVVGHDVDAAVLGNRSVDQAVIGAPHEPLAFADGEFDLVIADFVFEHVDDPEFVAAELARVLKPGGWICARTPNKWGYVSVMARLVANSLHRRVLRLAQPERQAMDVFPTRFRLNTMGAIRERFPHAAFENCSYYYQAEPSYHFDSRIVHLAMRVLDRMLPRALWSSLFVFLRKR